MPPAADRCCLFYLGGNTTINNSVSNNTTMLMIMNKNIIDFQSISNSPYNVVLVGDKNLTIPITDCNNPNISHEPPSSL